MDRREEAYQCFCHALAINPYDFSAIKNEIDILRSQGRTHELKKARVRLFSLYRQQPEAEELLKILSRPAPVMANTWNTTETTGKPSTITPCASTLTETLPMHGIIFKGLSG